jgi:hypothetical protein
MKGRCKVLDWMLNSRLSETFAYSLRPKIMGI